MPELPDVETYRRYVGATALHKVIRSTHVPGAELLEDTSPQALGRQLDGHAFEQTRRHGKYLFLQLDDGGFLVLHFGMTGRLRYFKDSPHPEHTQLLITFANGYRLAYVAPRKLGMIALTADMDDFVKRKELGPDALQLGPDDFRELLESSRGGVKSWLMNQHHLAGIGNVYSDEILFQARIHPRRSLKSLDSDDRQRLYRALQDVLKKTIDAQADPDRVPASFLLPHRQEGEPCPRCGTPVRQEEIAGRTAYYCPRCQPQ